MTLNVRPMNTKIVKHNSDPELAATVDIDVTVVSANQAMISGDRQLVDILIKWAEGSGAGFGLVSFDIETDDLILRACRATKIDGHSVTVVHFMRQG